MECLVYHTVDKIGMGKGRIKKTVFHVLNKTKQQQAMISLHFIGDKRMRNLNLAHRGKDKVTDVLAFSTKDGCGIKQRRKGLRRYYHLHTAGKKAGKRVQSIFSRRVFAHCHSWSVAFGWT